MIGRRTAGDCIELPARPWHHVREDKTPRTGRWHNQVMPTVAVIGASNDRRKFGNKALRAFLGKGYRVIPINPTETQVEGIPTYASVLDVPESIEMATVYVQPEVGVRLLHEFSEKKIAKIWINPGADSPELLAEARRLKLNVVAACSIIEIGQDPSSL